jgi:hypothetical protein
VSRLWNPLDRRGNRTEQATVSDVAWQIEIINQCGIRPTWIFQWDNKFKPHINTDTNFPFLQTKTERDPANDFQTVASITTIKTTENRSASTERPDD